MKQKLPTALIEKMYQKNMSTYFIAKELGIKPNSVRAYLHRKGIKKDSLGRMAEKIVQLWLEKNGNHVISQRGDHPFDLLVNGERVDVKASNLSKENTFCFQTQDVESKRNNFIRKTLKNYAKSFDWFYLVFIFNNSVKLFRLRAEAVSVKRTLKICCHLKTKYPIEYLGDLDKKNLIGSEVIKI